MTSSNSVLIVFIILIFGMQSQAVKLLDNKCLPVSSDMILFAQNASPAPWMAYITKNGTFICGGTLVSHRFVLTAAHCATSTHNLIVKLGEYDTTDDIPTTDFLVIKIVKHMKTDAALLKLDRQVRYSDNIKPICILSPELYKGLPFINDFIVTGWGATSDLDRRGSSTILKQMSAIRMHSPQCDDLEGDICGGNPADKEFICNGDSGGPLVAYVKYNASTTITAQYGVLRGSSNLCRDHAYYVDVNEISDWIFTEVILDWFLHKVVLSRSRRHKSFG